MIKPGMLVRVNPERAACAEDKLTMEYIVENNGYIYLVVEPLIGLEKGSKWYVKSIATGSEYGVGTDRNDPWRMWLYDYELVPLEEAEPLEEEEKSK